MSEEIVVPKKRGRPPKKAAAAAPAAEQDNAIVIDVPKRRRTKASIADNTSASAESSSTSSAAASKRAPKKNAAAVGGTESVPEVLGVKTSSLTTKRRGATKSGPSSSSSSTTSTSTTTSTSSASAPAPARAVDAELGDKQVADIKVQKATVSQAASSPSPSTVEGVDAADASSAKLKPKSRTRKAATATATVVEGSAGSVGPASGSAAVPAAPRTIKSNSDGAGNAKAVGTAAQLDASDANESQKPGALATSKILQQAKAFAENSRDLHDQAARLVEEREAVRESVLQQDQQVDVGEDVRTERQTVDEVAATTTGKDLKEPTARDLHDTQISSKESIADAGITSTTATSSLRQEESSTVDPVSASQAAPPSQLPSTFVPLATSSTSTTMSTPAFGFPKSKPKVQVVVPKYILPNSTVAALAARNVHSQRSSSSQGPSLPPSSAAARRQQQQQQQQGQGGFGPSGGESGRPRPTQIPLDQLKKDPEFRALSRRWTSLMVALPFAIVTSYFLWQRYEEHQAYLKSREAKRTLDSVSWKTAGSDDATSTSPSTAGPPSTPASSSTSSPRRP
ncbi:hypothetical protein HRR83_003289 [Exophiala dermatitidis]|uniref:Uncharacterized protein n=2 Tax=Exophiala dermatitidis TaxID=5970 RepID=H6BN21_EXODN|nr:uncharacterized protein HMPREF1120_00362 [Exophiala dermatitidis NIH/UT8656]KAJ4514800.1 hypothetical protein HRR75_004164 [Exophiala dermatitidis]EHY52145.1 hypothetical protein HMPREF1120_00362 [Exophiala dermatitidis NIH/UT8656]KAJ4518258.1 hypothetical protein HRR74_004553 [Exophiala dermatitidis]KAJ4521156.1 hypothetical protein HRR73_003497 [Exophiala dermatitidis]KAJ4547745.1 hypothetical protein HRR76_000371 [Exophiala dermatitidis]